MHSNKNKYMNVLQSIGLGCVAHSMFSIEIYFYFISSSLLALTGKNKTDELDPKKQKKMEKEEKEFRKKFKVSLSIKSLNLFFLIIIINPVTMWLKDPICLKKPETALWHREPVPL